MTKWGSSRVKWNLMLLASASAIAPGIWASASAQEAPATAAEATSTEEVPSESKAGDIVVTGTRVVRDGYQAPTPTTVIGTAEIAAKSPSNLADYVNTLPSLSGSATPRSTASFVSNGMIGINALNLRNLNPNRTLVLLDGQRVGASSLTGLVDINQFPQSLVKRIDVVTGGASASWGSDAVAGVVNFVLDKDYTGLKGQAQGGVTTYGDGRNYNISLTAGAKFAGGRGHILLAGELMHDDGIEGIGKRKWYNGSKILFNPAYAAGNGQPQLLVRDNVGIAVAAPGGLITSGNLRGTYFGANGSPAQLNYGSIVSGNFMVGGDSAYTDYGTSGNLSPKQDRRNVFGRVSYELTDSINIYGQASYTSSTAHQAVTSFYNLGNLTIQRDNAFIPASIASSVTGPFSLGTTNQDLGPLEVYNKRSSQRYVVGANGDFDALGTNWSWDVYAQKSINTVYNEAHATITANYTRAIDAVRNANGVIVCRSTLTNPGNGCVPYNVFGTGVNSQAAKDYVMGTSWGRTKLTEDVQAATLKGEPFSTWAGPVSIATGIEHRRESVTGSNDELSTTRAYSFGNYRASFGKYDVKEGFFETVVPLAKGSRFADTLDLNGAVRVTDYSTSGTVATWKLGVTYAPVSDLTFRVTRSRDIRAPNLAELFQTGVAGTGSISDPFRNNATSTFISTTQGNRNLKPEVANTLGLGAVFQPSFLPGFGASIDYYEIRINNAIATIAPATLVNQCFAGNTEFCSQITRSDAGIITGVTVAPINLATQKARGLDFEASYRRPLFGGNVTVRALATRFLENRIDNGINLPTDNVGKNSADVSLAAASGAGATSLPKWRYTASVAWDSDFLALSATARGFSGGVYNPAYVECTSGCPVSTTDNMTIDNNRLPGAIYFDTNVTIKLPNNIDAFFAVDNLLDKDPAQVAYGPNLGAAPLSVNAALYDTLGRTFRAGVRFKM